MYNVRNMVKQLNVLCTIPINFTNCVEDACKLKVNIIPRSHLVYTLAIVTDDTRLSSFIYGTAS